MTTNSVHPYRKPMSGPMDSRRNTYWPPARGYIAASSPYDSAPSSVMTPVSSHAMRSHIGEPTLRAMLADTMKIPEPIIDPATSIVASVRVIALTNSGCDCGAAESCWRAATVVIQLVRRLRPGQRTARPSGGRPRQNTWAALRLASERGLGGAWRCYLQDVLDLRLHT